MSDRRQRLLEGPIAPALIRLAVPIILGNALQTGYQLTDAFWLGRLGASAASRSRSSSLRSARVSPWPALPSVPNTWVPAARIW
jgi:hypothetical protein